MVRSHKAGEPVGITSVCSAHPAVLEASIQMADDWDIPICIESTCNQVNQHGGYTGMDPAGFRGLLMRFASEKPEKVIIGGDHLGPYPWRSQNADQAMSSAGMLIRLCAEAGYRKLHLDASMPCADDSLDADGSLEKDIIARRTAELASTAEEACRSRDLPSPCYVIGTEVPPPGGAEAEGLAVRLTSVSDVQETVETMGKAFRNRGLEDAWERVIAVVVQPGVEFNDSRVIDFSPERAGELSLFIETQSGLVFEAHSTDYQTAKALRALVVGHFAVLKVGPALTFAFREAVFALEEIERQWLGRRGDVNPSRLRDVLETAMVQDPRHWKPYYHGDDIPLLRRFSYSDRCRYYWSRKDIQVSLSRLLRNLSRSPIPATLISQYLPVQFERIRNGTLSPNPQDLIKSKVGDILSGYFRACTPG